MSHTILIDEPNGNGLFAVKTSSSSATHAVLASSVSNEDLSQSLSEYTDADESMSAPTEFLAEFLSAVMLKDYKKALKYCKLILHYEPNNATAKEFYPLIQEKLKFDSSSESDENYNKSSSPEAEVEIDQAAVGDEPEGDAVESDNSSSMGASDNLSSSGSVDAEVGVGGGVVTDNSSNGGGTSDSDEADGSTSDSDEHNLGASNSHTSTSSTSRSDNTTHSYSSLLLEEDDDAPPIVNIKELSPPNLDLSNGNLKSTSCSDSESPTEPLTQRLVAILRSKCVPGKATT